MNTDRNLLFGVLALHMEFITVQQFADVCAGWAARKETTVADLLIERGWMTEAEREEVDRLLKRKLDKNNGDERVTLSTMANYDVRDVFRDVEDDEIHQTLTDLDPASGSVELVETIETTTEERSHHELYGEYKEGGLGRVWRARDKVLNREVALKEIRPDRKVSENALRRFKIEAQVTSQLDHPNIVPVYELVVPKNSTPFYTMRYIQGQTLGDVIKVFHSIRKAKQPVERKLRDLLNAFVDVCNAIAFANERGVIHRDLKPSNVVMGRHGEVAVLDWGLLKIVDRELEEREEQSVTDIEIDDDLLADRTIPGARMGTYQYMAPEQAKGELRLIDRRTDVYGLGAILFRILTGRAPHLASGRSSLEVLEHIANEPTPTVGEDGSWAPKALVAICSKAMSHNRKERYNSAEDLAEDVQRWLADDPIDVYPEPWTHRAARWMRRHRSMTASIGVCLTLIAAVSLAAYVRVDWALQQEKQAKQEAVDAQHAAAKAQTQEAAAKQDAVDWFQTSRDMVDVMLNGVADSQQFAQDQSMRRALLTLAADYYRDLAGRDVSTDELRLEGGRSLIRLGNVQLLLGDTDDAIAAFEEAIDVLGQLEESKVASVDARHDMAVCLGRLGVAWDGKRDVERGAAMFEQAFALLDPLTEDREVLRTKAKTLIGHGELERHAGDFEQAERLFLEASEIAKGLRDDGEGVPQFVPELTTASSLRGEVLIQMGRSAEAVDPLNQSREHYLDLLGTQRDNPVLLEHFGFTCLMLTKVLRAVGNYEEALGAAQDGLRAYEELGAAMPDVPVFVENLAVALTLRARTLEEFGLYEESADELNRAALLMDRLFQKIQPQIPQWASACDLQTDLGIVQTILGRDEEAAAAFRKALREWENVQDFPLEYARGIGYTRRNLGRLLHRQGDVEGALEQYLAAIAAFQQALTVKADDLPALDGLALCYEHLGDLAGDRTPAEDGTAHYKAAFGAREKLPAQTGYTLKLVRLLLKTGQPSDVKAALAAVGELTSGDSGSVNHLTAEGSTLCMDGDWTNAIAALSKATDAPLGGARSPAPQFWLAITYARRNAQGDSELAKRHLELGIKRYQRQCPGDLEMKRLLKEATDAVETPPENDPMGGLDSRDKGEQP